jgi:Flp pilus assembly protein CpaB
LKRSNRLVLLVGVFLAIVAFVGILLLSRQQGPATIPPPTTGPVVVAKNPLPLSAKIAPEDVELKTVELTAILPGAFTDVSQVLGQVVRKEVAVGAQVTSDTLTGGIAGQVLSIDCPVGLRCMSVQVDQTTGVGTVIKTGDYVDMVVGLTGDKFPVITVNPADSSVTVVAGLNSTSTKVLLQGLQVMGTLLPPTPDTTGQAAPATGTPAQPATALNGQQEIVILAVDAQQAEVIKFAQIDASISLVLRSAADFIDPTTHQPLKPLPTETTGIILKSLVDAYGVLPPEVVETVTPAKP